MKAAEVFAQNNGEVTRAYYEVLNARGPAGQVAVALFRAQKRSTRAKKYRRGKWRHAAYDVKNWSLSEVCRLLKEHGAALSIRYGWKRDPNTPGFEQVLYVDLPNGHGQVSFHSAVRYEGPDYAGDWDGHRLSAERIIAYADAVMEGICEVKVIPESPKAQESEPPPAANWQQLTLTDRD